MRHRHAGRKLNRTSAHLLALKRNLAARLFAHEQIETTVPKARELRPFAEKLITLAKKGAQAAAANDPIKSLHYRRLLMAKLGSRKLLEFEKNKEKLTVDVVAKLMNEIGPRYSTREGGYTRILKLTKRRLGDASPLALISMVGANEPVKRPVKEKKAATA